MRISTRVRTLLSREPFRGGWHTLCLLDAGGRILAARTYSQREVDEVVARALAVGRAEFTFGYGPHRGGARRLYGIEWRTGGEARRPAGVRRVHRLRPSLYVGDREQVRISWTVIGNREGAISD